MMWSRPMSIMEELYIYIIISVVNEKELKKRRLNALRILGIEGFVPRNEVNCLYFDKPYYLVPVQNGEKGYVVFRKKYKKYLKRSDF